MQQPISRHLTDGQILNVALLNKNFWILNLDLLQSSSKKGFQFRIAFNTLYLLKYFGMVTMEQKERKRVEHV